MNKFSIILDLDGSLLNEKKEIGTNNLEALQEAIIQGCNVTLASGRSHELMIPFAKQLGLTGKIICCNGAYQYCLKEKKIINTQAFDSINLNYLFEALESKSLYYTLYCSNGIYATEESPHTQGIRKQFNALTVDSDITILSDLNKLKEQCGDIYKVLASSPEKKVLHELKSLLDDRFQTERSHPNKLDINHKDVNKGRSVEQWLTNNSLNPKNAVAFGDADNDLEMFKVVGEPVAMLNASPKARGMANTIITRNDGCGIGQYIRYMMREIKSGFKKAK